MKRLFLSLLTTAATACAVMFCALPASVSAAVAPPENGSSSASAASSASNQASNDDSGRATDDNGCVKLSVGINSSSDKKVCDDGNGGGVIIVYLKMILRFLAGGVGLVVFLMLVVAGIQYITAAGLPEQIKAAKKRIQNAVTALVLFLLAYAILNFIIPGGVFG